MLKEINLPGDFNSFTLIATTDKRECGWMRDTVLNPRDTNTGRTGLVLKELIV